MASAAMVFKFLLPKKMREIYFALGKLNAPEEIEVIPLSIKLKKTSDDSVNEKAPEESTIELLSLLNSTLEILGNFDAS